MLDRMQRPRANRLSTVRTRGAQTRRCARPATSARTPQCVLLCRATQGPTCPAAARSAATRARRVATAPRHLPVCCVLWGTSAPKGRRRPCLARRGRIAILERRRPPTAPRAPHRWPALPAGCSAAIGGSCSARPATLTRCGAARPRLFVRGQTAHPDTLVGLRPGDGHILAKDPGARCETQGAPSMCRRSGRYAVLQYCCFVNPSRSAPGAPPPPRARADPFAAPRPGPWRSVLAALLRPLRRVTILLFCEPKSQRSAAAPGPWRSILAAFLWTLCHVTILLFCEPKS